MLKKLTILLFSIFLITFNANAGSDGKLTLKENKSEAQNTKDCFEKLNRATFAFNQGLDKALIKPIAEGYRKLPDNVQKGTSNAVRNLSTLITIPNNVLQGDIKTAIINTARLAVNTTVGLLGTIDVANKMGFPKYEKEDYGQTLATWGVGDGFYLVLPLFGPSNLRDTSGMVLTMLTDPINAYAVSEGEAWLVPMRTAVNAVDTRSQIIDEVNALRDNSVDYYAAVRSSYYQNRKAAINNVDDSELTPLPLISIEFE